MTASIDSQVVYLLMLTRFSVSVNTHHTESLNIAERQQTAQSMFNNGPGTDRAAPVTLGVEI